MFGINLHEVVRSGINQVHPDEEVTLYQAIGQTNVKGTVLTKYAILKNISAQFQPLSENRLTHSENSTSTPSVEQAFLTSDPTFPVAGIRRKKIARSGDYIQRADGIFCKVTAVLEDWSNVGWCNVEVTDQIKPPDFSGSDWYEGGEGSG